MSGLPQSGDQLSGTVERAAKAAGFDMKIHPHMLRHACGFKLANDGHDTRAIQAYLGHCGYQFEDTVYLSPRQELADAE